MQSTSQAIGRLDPDLDDAAEFLAAIWPLWHDKVKRRGTLEEVHPLILAAFERLVGQWSSGKPIRLPDLLLPEYGQDVRPWLHTVGRNAIIDLARAERTRRRYERKAALQVNHYGFVGRAGRSAELTYMRLESEREPLGAIDRLPPKLREVVGLVYEGQSVAEIAQKLGVSARTIYNRLESIRSPRIRRMLLDAAELAGEEYVAVKNPMIRSAN